MKQIVLLMMI